MRSIVILHGYRIFLDYRLIYFVYAASGAPKDTSDQLEILSECLGIVRPRIFIIIIIINRIFIQDINHFSPKRTVINVSPVKYSM